MERLTAVAMQSRLLSTDTYVRLVVVDDRGHVRSVRHASGALEPARMFAVVLLWQMDGQGIWRGWLSTIDHQSLCFTGADLAMIEFQRWLAALPGWRPEQLSAALATPGLHQVWRRPGE